MAVDVVVCAHNEAEQLPAVLAAVANAPSVGQIIVVADDCTDTTVGAAAALATRVLRTSHGNKGSAMAAGLTQVATPGVCFCDADLIGLSPAHVEWLLTAEPATGQVVGIPDSDIAPPWWPSLSGERRLPVGTALRAGLDGSGWRAETRLNAQVAREGLPWRHYRLVGVHNPFSWHPGSWVKVPAVEAAYLPELIAYTLHPAGASLPTG